MYDLIIIGGGPAAVAAAFYAIDKQMRVLLVYEDLGGKVGARESLIRYDQSDDDSTSRRYVRRGEHDVAELIPALPANRVVRLLVSQIMRHGHVLHDCVQNVAVGAGYFSVETRNQGVLQAKTVLIATGATPLRLVVPGADRFVDRAMDYSIATYAQHAGGQRVAVIGDTPRAVFGAAELARTAAHVTLIVPGTAGLATPLGVGLQHQPNVDVLIDADVTEICGQFSIDAVVVRVGGQLQRLPVERAFVDLGLVPNSRFVQNLVTTDRRGFIVVDQQNATSVPGVFAAGDVTTTACEQVLAAIGDGARAAMSAQRYVLTQALVRDHPLADQH